MTRPQGILNRADRGTLPLRFENTVQKPRYHECDCDTLAIPSIGTSLGYHTCRRCGHLIGVEGTRKTVWPERAA